MTKLTLKSPGVSTREIDLSGPTTTSPSGIPAGVIGTAIRGPAFVPVTVATFQDFISKFGNTDGEKFGPLAMSEWLRSANAGTYVRLLGVGDGKKRESSGRVANAGFVVGQDLVRDNGLAGANPYATADNAAGRTYFLGAFHSPAAGSSFLQEAGLLNHASQSAPIIRAVLMAPSGVLPTLGSDIIATSNNKWKSDTSAPGGSPFGTVAVGSGKQEFSLILNGHIESDSSPNLITASFDPTAPNYISRVLNKDPLRIEELGHYLHTCYTVYSTDLVLSRSFGPKTIPDEVGSFLHETAFLLSSSQGRNAGTAGSADAIGVPNFEGFEDRFKAAYSPFVISQKFGGKNKNLFRLHALDDGRAGSDAFKISIENIGLSANANNPYGKFDVVVRFFADDDSDPVVLERFAGLTTNPSDDNFIARRIGDMHTFFDFDKNTSGQKIVIDGTYPNRSNYIRVELSDELKNDNLDAAAIPVGFRGLDHLVTSGSTIAGGFGAILTGSYNVNPPGNGPRGLEHSVDSLTGSLGNNDLARVVQLPVPMRRNIAQGTSPKKIVDSNLYWGFQTDPVKYKDIPNAAKYFYEDVRSFVRFMPSYDTNYQKASVGNNEGTPDIGGSILDADRFNNNLFSLEKIEVLTGSNDRPDQDQWAVAEYRRDGKSAGTLTDIDGVSGKGSRLLDPSKDFSDNSTRKYLKFTFPLQGGFDGVNIFDEDKSKFRDSAVRREMDDNAGQGGTSGPTVSAYRKAISVMEEKTDVDIQLLAIPGIRHESVTDFAIESVERRFDALYVMDIEERDTLNSPVTGSGALINVGNTVSAHAGKNFDTSFAAAYFPDVVITDPATSTNVQCPPSVAVLGAMAYNDAVAHPWFAPAGFNRGALDTVVESQVKLNRSNLDDLYDADINPITSFPNTGVVVFGQKTLLATQSALDRVNVRRLLIDVRRKVKNVANSLLFEPNRAETLSRFTNAVTPILARIQQQQGLDRFKVNIDTTTTTQADVENNTIRGKIFLQPTRSVEFISLDFVVTNAGSDAG